MPLIHSKSPKAFSKNVATEMHAGKPQKQAVAIAYSEQRHANQKKMSMGGETAAGEEEPKCIGAECKGCSSKSCYAKGGEVTTEPDNLDAIGTEEMDSDLHDMLGSEILGAIEAKDHKMLWSGLEAMVLSMMNKGNE